MAAHMLDHFVFTARRLSERTKSIVFAVVAFAIVANFWWFRGVAWGIDGPISEHWGLGWRKVSCRFLFSFFSWEGKLMIFRSVSRGIFMICSIGLMRGRRIFSSPSLDLPQGNISKLKKTRCY
jgi:hypothetical protein